MATKVKRASYPWHDKNLVYTRWGKNNMRALLIVGVVLGFILGVSTCLTFLHL